MQDCKALESAVEQIAALSADLRVCRITADNLSSQLTAAKEIAESRKVESDRLKEHHREFVIALVKSKCAGRPEHVIIDDLIYDEYERECVVSIQRLSRGESLMFRDTSISPQRVKASSQEPD